MIGDRTITTEAPTITAENVTGVRLDHRNVWAALANGIYTDDDDFDRRHQRRRYEEPLLLKVRKQLLTIAESVSHTLPRYR